MPIKIMTRNVPVDKIDCDKEVVKLIKVKAGEGVSDDLVQVLSIYNTPDASKNYYRLDGVKNNYFRKADKCNNITFTDDDIVYAKLGDIHYDLPEHGVPQRDTLKAIPDDDAIGGIINMSGFTIHVAAGDCLWQHGMESGEDHRWVESVSVLKHEIIARTLIKFKDDEKIYILDNATSNQYSRENERVLLTQLPYVCRNRYGLRMSVVSVRPILPVTWLDESTPRQDKLDVRINAAKPVRHAGVLSKTGATPQYVQDIKNRAGKDHQVGLLVNAIAFKHSDATVYLEVETPSKDKVVIQTTFDKLEGGWNLRSDLQQHTRSFVEFYVVYLLEEDAVNAEEEAKRASAPETVVWTSEKIQKPASVGTYVTAIVVPVQSQMRSVYSQLEDNISDHMKLMEQYIPGLKWEEVQEVRGNWDVVVHGSIISGTAGAKEQLAKQMHGDIDVVLVGILPL